jgi:hypothetical protein
MSTLRYGCPEIWVITHWALWALLTRLNLSGTSIAYVEHYSQCPFRPWEKLFFLMGGSPVLEPISALPIEHTISPRRWSCLGMYIADVLLHWQEFPVHEALALTLKDSP